MLLDKSKLSKLFPMHEIIFKLLKSSIPLRELIFLKSIFKFMMVSIDVLLI